MLEFTYDLQHLNSPRSTCNVVLVVVTNYSSTREHCCRSLAHYSPEMISSVHISVGYGHYNVIILLISL